MSFTLSSRFSSPPPLSILLRRRHASACRCLIVAAADDYFRRYMADARSAKYAESARRGAKRSVRGKRRGGAAMMRVMAQRKRYMRERTRYAAHAAIICLLMRHARNIDIYASAARLRRPVPMFDCRESHTSRRCSISLTLPMLIRTYHARRSMSPRCYAATYAPACHYADVSYASAPSHYAQGVKMAGDT